MHVCAELRMKPASAVRANSMRKKEELYTKTENYILPLIENYNLLLLVKVLEYLVIETTVAKVGFYNYQTLFPNSKNLLQANFSRNHDLLQQIFSASVSTRKI